MDLGRDPETGRFQIQFNLPGGFGGQKTAVRLEAQAAAGQWHAIGNGTACAQALAWPIVPRTARVFRLATDAPAVRQFDLFPAADDFP